MATKTKSATAIKGELIATIKRGIEEVGDKTEIARRLGMSRANLNYHLNPDGPYTNNIKMLGEIGEIVGEMQTEKRTLAQNILTTVQEKINP